MNLSIRLKAKLKFCTETLVKAGYDTVRGWSRE